MKNLLGYTICIDMNNDEELQFDANDAENVDDDDYDEGGGDDDRKVEIIKETDHHDLSNILIAENIVTNSYKNDEITIGIKNIPQNFELEKRLHGPNDEHITRIKRITGATVTIRKPAKADPYVEVKYSKRETRNEARRLIVKLIKSLQTDFIAKYGQDFTTIEKPRIFVAVFGDDFSYQPPKISNESESSMSTGSLKLIAPWNKSAPVPPPTITSNKKKNVAGSSTITKNNVDEMNLNPSTSHDTACVTLTDDKIDHDSLVRIEPSKIVESKKSESNLTTAVEGFEGIKFKIPTLTGNNYQEWKIKVQLMFRIWMKSDLLIGKNVLTMSPQELEQWKASNKQAVAVILFHVDYRYVPIFIDISYVKELLDTMDQYFGDSDESVPSVENNKKRSTQGTSEDSHHEKSVDRPCRTALKDTRDASSWTEEVDQPNTKKIERKVTDNNEDSDEEISIVLEEETNVCFSDRTGPGRKFMRGNGGDRIAQGSRGAPKGADELPGTSARTHAPNKASGSKRGKSCGRNPRRGRQ